MSSCEEFRLIRSKSLASSLNIVLYPTFSPSAIFMNHLYYTPHSADPQLCYQNISQICLFLTPTASCVKPLFYPTRYLVPYFHFRLSTLCSSQRRQNYSFEIKIRTSHSFAQNLLVILVCPIRPCIFLFPCSLFGGILHHAFSRLFNCAYMFYLRAFALAWNPPYPDNS